MIFRLNIRICFKSGAKTGLFCRKSAATALKFVVNQGQLGISLKKVAHQIRCVTFIFLYGLPPKPRAAIVWSLIINLPARKSCHTWWYSLCLEIAITRQLVSKTIFITIGDKEFFCAMSQSSSAFLLSFPHAPTLHLILPVPSWLRNQSSANASGLFTHCIISKSSSCAWLKTVAAISKSFLLN